MVQLFPGASNYRIAAGFFLKVVYTRFLWGSEMVSESWFRSLWKTPWKREAASEKAVMGVLAFEIASLMSKLVHQWQSLSDKQVARLREETMNSVGIKKLVSDDEEFIAKLICAEMIENLKYVARSLSRIGKKCNDSTLKGFEHVFEDLIKIGANPSGWEYTRNKMEKKVKKMERFILINVKLYQEMEMLQELEQTLRRMKGNDEPDSDNLLEFKKKVVWKQHEVKTLRNISLWNKSYDYTVRLLARSVFTIFNRLKHVFGIYGEVKHSGRLNQNFDYAHPKRKQSVSAVLQSSAHTTQNGISRFSSGPLGRVTTESGPIVRTKNEASNFFSGPIGSSTRKPVTVSGSNKTITFYSGPLVRSVKKLGPIFGAKNSNAKSNLLNPVNPFKGCMVVGNTSPLRNGELIYQTQNIDSNLSVFSSKRRSLKPPEGTLGASALALHYANVIIVIEKLVASPHLIGHDARDDLYNMLPSSIRASLRARLKPYTKTLSSSIYDSVLANEWNDAMTTILEWLSPLAHNMIRWQSERSFEQQSLVSRTNVLLVQTLYFANQEKTESTITELLVGLNYVWRFGRELNAKSFMETSSSRIFDEYLD